MTSRRCSRSPVKAASAVEVRAAIARHLHGPATARRLGDIQLHPHQEEAAARVRRLLDVHGGALLADDVGLGKTFVALDVARDAVHPLVIAPASIRAAWADAGRRTGVVVRFISVESLSRGAVPVVAPDLVIVDEAHHLRTPATKRYRIASALCATARVLLMTATPVQNSLDDLRALLALIAGARVTGMTREALAGFVVRRAASDVRLPQASLPRVAEPQWLAAVDDVDCLDRLLALPRAVPPSDGDDGGVLLSYTLVRQWASSRAALVAALRRRLARAHALEDALVAGRMPTRAELAAWTFADGTQQLAFPELAVARPASLEGALLPQVRLHAAGVRELLAWIERSPDPDTARATSLRDVRRRHPGERVIVFSEYADTVTALYRMLAPDSRVALLTHGGGRVAGGAITRREILTRFEPGAARRTAEAGHIDMLLSTDVLSEGVNLQDASVVVHLDLSWNPARLEQRVGRVRRLGAVRDVVSVYLMPAPAPAERMLQLDRRLRLKLGVAARTLGLAGSILPGVVLDSYDAGSPREERIAAGVRGWIGQGDPGPAVLAGASRSTMRGALACIRSGDDTSLVAICDGRVTDARDVIERVVAEAGGESVVPDGAAIATARQAIERWLRHRFVSGVVNLPALRVARTRRAMLHRVDAIARRAPRHAHPRLAPLMHAARAAATATLSSGAERVLDELTRCAMQDEAWLQAVGEFAALHARGGSTEPPRILALLLLLPEDGL
jgi:superfamily II DNA or RNA helicase